MMCRSFECAGQDPRNIEFNPEFPVIENALSENQEEEDIYYYHTDHLGSSSWITYTDGSVTQHMQNLPFGEPFIDQRATSYDVRFKFTGKEMDAETGYQYFGARYYNSDISVWLSVDPLSFERPNLSLYNYSSWNPVMRIDPDGNLDTRYEDKDGNLLGETNDGNDATVVVADDKIDSFKSEYEAAKKAGSDVTKYHNKKWIGYGEAMQVKSGGFVANWALDALNPEVRKEIESNENINTEYNGIRISPTGPSLIIFGSKLIPKSGGVGGGGAAGKWTSIASKSLRWTDKTIQGFLKTSVKLPAKGFLHRAIGTRGIGAAAGRLIPGIGWVILGAEIGHELGKNYGPSTWYGDDDNRWFR